jgi:hypothetical protein
MKTRIRRNKKTGETFVTYGAGFDIGKHRYTLLGKIIENWSPVMLIIDSNQKTGNGSLQESEELLAQSGIKYSAFPAKQNNTKIFGFEIPRKAMNQKMIVMEVSSGQFSRELYDICLKRYDIAIGIGRLKSFEETCDMLRVDLSEVLFNTVFFKESIYDSVVCGSLRSSADIKPYIEAAINETAL